ncbi:MAG TPA: MlaD family protein [Gemmatimonadales bacterium]|nr:MlaD family protein [Gemmatimonadales bacterium]
MDLRYSREATVGAIVIAAILLFIFGTMWLSGRSIGRHDTLKVQFADASGLKKAAPVRISGVPVGKVEDVVFVDVGKVIASLSLPPKITPKVDATATITSISLVGDYAVDFDPGQAAEPLPAGRVIIGKRQTELSDRAQVLGEKADTLMTNLQAFINPATAANLNRTLESLQQTMATLNRQLPATTGNLNRTMTQFAALSAQLERTLQQPGLQRALNGSDTLVANLSTMSRQLAVTSARLDSVMGLMQHGQGTLGKLATDSTLYFSLVGVTRSMDSLLTELKKHPGKLNISPEIRIF